MHGRRSCGTAIVGNRKDLIEHSSRQAVSGLGAVIQLARTGDEGGHNDEADPNDALNRILNASWPHKLVQLRQPMPADASAKSITDTLWHIANSHHMHGRRIGECLPGGTGTSCRVLFDEHYSTE